MTTIFVPKAGAGAALGNPIGVYAGVSGPTTLSWSDLDLNINLTGNLAAGEITFSNLPTNGNARQITIEVVQGTSGGHTIASDAWTGVDWGTTGSPIFGGATGESKIVTLYYNGTKIFGFTNSTVFP